MARPALLLAAALLVLGACAPALAAEQQRVLVLLNDADLKATHSRFLGALSARYALDVQPMSDASLRIKSWGDWLYDKLVILGSGQALGGALDVAQIAEFVDSGRDVLLAVDSGVSEELRELAQELGVDIDASGHAVIDHFAYDKTTGSQDHASVLSSGFVAAPAVLPPGLKTPVLFRGVGLSVPDSSETAFIALRGSPTAYSGKPGEAALDAKLAGPSMALVALVQARNNARVAVAGSLHMFSDAAYDAQATDRTGSSLGRVSNEAFCTAIAAWAFQQRGVLRASKLTHRVLAGAEPGAVEPERYRINDEVEFSVTVEECTDGACAPFKADDVQVELVMLDPHVRAPLAHDGAGRFSAAVRVPDVYGVFKWVLDYRRLGYSYIQLTETVPIRPFKHDEYERFIAQAAPYYASIAACMAGFLALSAAFLWTK